MTAEDDFERVYQSLGLPADTEPDAVDATWGQASSGPTYASGSQPAPGVPRPTTSTLPQLEIATPHAARTSGEDSAELTPIEVLGEGGMGQVLVARQWSLEREVAVKVLKHQATDDAARALVDEARIAGGLEHPGIVPIYALARDAQGLPAVVMKRVEGTSWEALLKDPQHPAWARVAPVGKDRLEAHLGILVQVCNALAFAHRRGVLHRDLKPANVLVGELGEVYLADWGIATRKGQSGPPRLVGTPAYMAPEMVRGELGAADERTDVYLVGATLFEVLTGRPPHHAQALKEALQQAWDSPPPQFGADVPGELTALCARCLARDPAQRPADALAVRDALLGFLQHRGSVRLTDSARERLAKLEATSAADPAQVHALLSECRFAFTQALREWPENAAATAGLVQAVTFGVRHELNAGNPRAARLLLNDLASPPPALAAEVAAAEAAEAARRSRSLELERLAHENDPQVAVAERNRLALSGGAVVGAMFLAFRFGLREFLQPRMGEWFRLVPLVTFVVGFSVALVLGRRTLMSTRLNRQLMVALIASSAAVVVTRAISIGHGVPVHVSFALDSCLLATSMVVGAIFTSPRLLMAAATFALSAAGCLLFPDASVPIFTAGSGASLVALAYSQRAWRTPGGPPTKD